MFWRGVWGYLPANVVQGVVGFLTLIVFTRLLSAEDFGRYALAFSVLTLAHVAVFTWLEAAMARFWAAETAGEPSMAAHFASLYRAVFLLTGLFGPVAALGVWLAPLDLPMKLAVAAGLFGVPIRCLMRLAQERFRAAGEVRKAATLDVAVTLGGFLIGVGFALGGAGGASPLLGLALAPLFALPFILPGELRIARGGRFEPKRMRGYAVYGYPIAASLALSVVLASTDRFLLALFLDEAAVGAYHAAYSIANRTLDVLFVWLGAAGTPALVMALEKGGVERLQTAAREQASTFLLIGVPAAVGVMLVARPLADFVLGEDLRVAAAGVTPLVALGALFSGVTTYYFHQAFTLGRKTPLLLLAMCVPAAANVALNLVLIPWMGLAGAAWATLISLIMGAAASAAIGRGVIALPVPWTTLGQCLTAAALMAVVVSLLPSPGGFVELMLKAWIGAIVYGLAAYALNIAGVRDVIERRLAARREAAA